MNKYFKFMTAALAVTALASCSEKLDFEQQAVSNVKESDMVATLLPFDMESNTRVGVQLDNQVVWAEDDEVRVYSLNKLTFNSYVLDENQPAGQGAGYSTAVMKEEIIQDKTSTNDYAVAQPKANKDVRISSSENGNALLQAKIPSEYEWATVQDAGTAYKVPSQYWGKVTSTKPFSCEFHALTSYIKLDLKDLPAGTKSILLISHEDFDLNGIQQEGGKNEPLSGNFEAELIDKNSKLEASEDLTTKDYFRIDFEESDAEQDKILFIPVIAQTYEKLYLIAVTQYGKDIYDIWDGEILKVWENEEFKVNVAKAVSLGAEIVYAGTDPEELAELIAENYDGKHTVRVVCQDVLDPGTLYIVSNTEGKNNVQITFEVQQTNDLEIVEAPLKTGFGGLKFDDTKAADGSKNDTKARTVSLKYVEGATGGLDITLPTSYVDIDTEDAFDGEISILAAKSNTAKPLSPARNVAVGIVSATDAKDAPIAIHSSNSALTTFAKVFVKENSVSSAIYVFNPNTEITELGIGCKTPGNVRITDALVEKIAYEDAIGGAAISLGTQSNIFTDGSAAIKDVTGSGNKVKVQADWTGKGLTLEAVQNDYDQANVYTAAQLQGMGLAVGSGNGTAVTDYIIADKVTDMWLGGSDYPWQGPAFEVLDPATFMPLGFPLGDDIKFDGNHKGLYNMVLSLDDPYFTSPHWCCTTCGGYTVKVEENLGLIRDIFTTGKATVQNVRLNDALIDTKNYRIPNVGTLVGSIVADTEVKLDDNQTTNIRVNNVGGNAGGHVGLIDTDGNVTMKKSVVTVLSSETDVNEFFVKTVGDNAGGLVGFIDANTGKVEATSSTVKLDEVSAEKGSNVGGLAGQLNYGVTEGKIETAKVTIPVLKATENAKDATNAIRLNTTSGNNVGGLVGWMWNDNIAAGADNIFNITKDVTVTAKKEINAGNQYAGGLIGLLQMIDGNDDANNKAILGIANVDGVEHNVSVTVKNLIATNGFAGGLVAANGAGDVTIIDEVADKPAVVSVDITSLQTAFCGAGVIGENDDDVKIKCDDDDALSVTVSGWKNTWQGSYFDNGYASMSSSTLNKLCGTFAHILGQMNENLDMWTKNVTKNDGIKAAVKEALFFKKHTDATNTVGVTTDPFWGDKKYYIGFSNKTGFYSINGVKQADQEYNYRTSNYVD